MQKLTFKLFCFIFQRKVHENLLESVPMLKEITVSLFAQEICEPAAIILQCIPRALICHVLYAGQCTFFMHCLPISFFCVIP